MNNELIYSKPYDQNDEPIYSVPYNQSNQPIYEYIQFYSSETPSNKYYKGPINDDIYAKVDKTNIDKSELLKKIDNFILENSENYPLVYQHVKKVRLNLK
ncbi:MULTISPECIES: hypothetical protein [Symbiopectobacterium]|uniref:hypothetical protein n=1 Tax=Symbiopectobacterium TaxID=801 RepID=UPI001A24F291|nr:MULTISPECIES: hypothetical protein [Symbiopectobacterium]MBG6248544.1 hypothetical protein [Candidatus Symbiopectobacterium sp. PLON1]MBT9430298.1 hypothetical protein [Candidatus Symbiopectobacterium endolongispinus]